MDIHRRGLFRLIAWAFAAGCLGATRMPAKTKRYGPVDVSRHRALSTCGIHLHVIHEGRDITKRCRFADDTGGGLATVYLHDLNGRKYLRGNEVAKEIVYGVTFIEGAPL